ncbi:MAG: hypothetical protein Q9225_002513, partial [Loekoesia sp. 1 TL-2023]
MDLSTAALAANATQPDHHNTWRDADSSAGLPTPDGQDHDRMETDDDSHGSISEDDLGNNQTTTQTPFENDEIMDTTPDEPNGEEHLNGHAAVTDLASSSPFPQALTTTSADQNPLFAAPEHPEISHNHSGHHDTSANDGQNAAGPPPSLFSSMVNPTEPHETPATSPPEQVVPANAPPPEDASTPPPVTIPESSSPQEEANEPEQQQGREDDSSQAESSDEEERPYWAEFEEDTSGPDEGELEIIEQDATEVDARGHTYWESMTYEALEDPEYIPLESGRISWTVTPVNGTPGNPNREKIMRSHSVLIGGLYWNIKYYPRGNDGTEHMSVYIECSPSQSGGLESDDDSDTSSSEENVAPASGRSPGENNAADEEDVSQSPNAISESPHHVQEVDEPVSTARARSRSVRWEAAAQVGCVVYNPNEPRVNIFRKSSHRFNPDDADWGWTRFHGPWESIHLRQRNERQALLRNDTLVFCAYIRTVKDDTRSLWWHAPKKTRDWDSYERIGVKSLGTGLARDNHIVAAISCWLNLRPIVNFIRNMKIPGVLAESKERRRPLFKALQQLVEYMFERPGDTRRDAMVNVVKWMDWYITETDPSRFDVPEVVAVWECLRRLLNYEASGQGDMAAAPDCFQDVLLLKQPDPWTFKSPISSAMHGQDSNATTLRQSDEPRSVQETIDLAASSNQFRHWENFAGNSPEPHDDPAVLQIELHRQQYDSGARRWDKLIHRIELNENITYTSPRTHTKCDYTLFGMIVHSGALESQDVYSVLRPQGPGTRWIRYSGGHFRREASCLTRAQAITSHEGKGRNTTGDAAVAYIVLYVRTDSLSDILIPLPQPHNRSSLDSNQQTSSSNVDSESPVPVRVFRSTLFDGHKGRGLPDLWAPNTTENAGRVHDLHFPRSTTLFQLAKQFEKSFDAAKDCSETDSQLTIYRWWYLDTGLSTPRGLPRLISIGDETLERAATTYDGVRLWLHVHQYELPTGNTDVTMTQPGSSAEIQEVQAPSENVADDSGDAVMTQDQPIEPATHAEASEASNQNHGTIFSPFNEAQLSSRDDAPVPTSQEQGSGSSDPENATMGEGQELVAVAQPQAFSLTTPSMRTIYIFVKIFDSQAQTLRAVGSRLVPLESNIHTEVTRILGSEDTFDIYHENSRSLSENDRVRSSRTFSDYVVHNGSIFIAQRQQSPEEIEVLLSQGKHPDPPSFFDFLRYVDDPSYLVSHDVNNSFGTEYTSADVLNGFVHGQGTMIYTNGDAYVGNWVANQKSGHGTMAYASGDTYTGEWAQNEREGHGKMVYGKTNNVYEGGWKKGRRHGKGVMTYEVADEEMAMCKICYENEMDALLYDCGH